MDAEMSLSPLPIQTLSVELLEQVMEEAREYIEHAKAANTKKAYTSDWRVFIEWCERHALSALPAAPETVALFLTTEAKAGRKTSTLQRRISAISQAHQAAGYESPTHALSTRSVWAGIRKVHGTAQHGKAPAVIDDIRLMVGALPDNLLGVRDRALLLLGFAGAFRRSELVSLNLDDLQFNRDGLTVLLRRSKTDQEGEGRQIGIPYGSNPDTCPVRAMQEWLEASHIDGGAIFCPINRHGQIQPSRLSDKAVALIVKRAAAAAGLDPTIYAGHSLRAGLATTAAMNGASERVIMKQTGHKSERMVRKYIREGNLFRENAAAYAGL